MEFIPLETQSKKAKKGGKKGSPGKGQKDAETLNFKKSAEIIKAGKGKLQSKMIEKKKVKNKYREVVAKKGLRRVALKKKNDKDKDEDEDESHDDKDKEEEGSSKKSHETSEMDEEGSDNEGGEEDDDDDDEEEEEEDEETMIEKKQENAIKEKMKKTNEKMKSRLFVKMKKKILNEAQVKELHPDIRGVIFPRKKRPRWCWAVFASQEKAIAAFQKLIKNGEVFVSMPNPHNKVEMKREKKLMTIKRKKENRKKLQQMWS